MQFVLVRPNDNDNLVELLAVQHPKKTPLMFQCNWDDALNAVKKSNPQEWDVNEVFGLLKDHGWTIMKLDTITLEY